MSSENVVLLAAEFNDVGPNHSAHESRAKPEPLSRRPNGLDYTSVIAPNQLSLALLELTHIVSDCTWGNLVLLP